MTIQLNNDDAIETGNGNDSLKVVPERKRAPKLVSLRTCSPYEARGRATRLPLTIGAVGGRGMGGF